MVPDTVTSGTAPLAVRTRTLQLRGQPKSLMKVGGRAKANGTETKAKAVVLRLAAGAAGGGASGEKTSITTGTDATIPPGEFGKGFKEPLTETTVWPGTVKVRLALLAL